MSDPLFNKTWKMSSAKSVYSTDFKPTTETRNYEERDNGYKLTVKGSQSGRDYQWSYEAYYDGKPHPVIGRPDADSITIYKLDAYNTVGFFSRGDEPAGPYRRKVASDGKSLMVEMAGRNSNGSPFYDVIRYDL